MSCILFNPWADASPRVSAAAARELTMGNQWQTVQMLDSEGNACEPFVDQTIAATMPRIFGNLAID